MESLGACVTDPVNPREIGECVVLASGDRDILAADACDDLRVTIELLATGLRRALARRHDRNESVNPRDAVLGVDHRNQSGISADAPTSGA